MKTITAGALRVVYLEAGRPEGLPVVLLHGFPYDVHTYDDVCPLLASAGCRVFTPYLRGYGDTRFLSDDTPRSGQQAALAHDLLAFMDAVGIQRAVLGGYDWGGRAACIVAALWPQRVTGLVSGNGYNIQDIPKAVQPEDPQTEHRYWYQYYFHGERGRAGLARNRFDFCRYLWRLWSPRWPFDEATYARTAGSFNNPDFVDVVIHSYRHRFGLVSGDPAVEQTEERLIAQPRIDVPTIALAGDADGVIPAAASLSHDRFFTAAYEHRVIPGTGHNLPQEAPQPFVEAVLTLIK
jgi:pimeloyl-ACP methyl ester carboxylesterase